MVDSSRFQHRRSAISVAIALALAVASWLFTHRDLPWYLWSGDAKEYAEMARRLADGDGLTTGVIYPAELSLGADRNHPAVVRPPAWPLLIGPFFALLGPEEWVVHGLVLACHFVSVACTIALATSLAGWWTGLAAGLALAVTSPFLMFALDGTSEPLLGALTTLSFLLCARGARPFWPGLTIGLAYLTHYNGVLLLPAALLLVAYRERRLRPVLACLAGFVAVAAPGWIRSLLVAGNPLYSPLALNLYMSPRLATPHAGLLHMLSPDISSPAAMNPFTKAALQLPAILTRWPLANANVVACLGVLLACIRRDPLSLAFAITAGSFTVALSFALAKGRYFMPLVPTLLALGAAGWSRYGGRLGIPALVLLLAAPLVPDFPPALEDISFQRAATAELRREHREGRLEFGDKRRATTALSRCLTDRDLVVAEDASELVWLTGAVAIQLPATEADLWTIVDAHPVRYLRVGPALRRRLSADVLAARFRPRPDCGPDFYERRSADESAFRLSPQGSSS